ncbi:acetate kinase [Mycoplasma mycoides]|uniref:acetate kinase n=1 Tax=Mycoplasma mycoides TaxID=2102 RepID=UPI002240B1C7|nr:acetate kinase [Mycoplasma mycoides]QVK06208.1 acetate kinase [Mycoplasma mycoides subsp. capri]QVK08735.1 acetate kinase [Mycoplasma mycoides subsp. capri]
MILVINSGSSSIKFKLFDTSKTIEPILDGLAERIGIDGFLKFEHNNQKYKFEDPLPDHEHAIQLILNKLLELKIISNIDEINGVGFRVVHGGQISHSSIITDEILSKIQDSVKLAPLHNPAAIIAIKAVKKLMPNTNMVACFDTAFHQTMPEVNYLYTVPYKWYEEFGVRKYGFHGISYEYIVNKSSEILNKKKENLNLIVCHLGNGASISCIKDGKTYDTSMGLTPLAGLMMGTRSGDIDVSICEYIAKQTNTDIFTITQTLNKQSGLLGLSQVSADMRDVLEQYDKNDKKAVIAVEKYVQIVADFIVKYANYLDNIDAVVFTAGIGENADVIRDLICKKVKLLDLQIDQDKNQAKYSDYKLISSEESKIPVYAIRTNEEKMICLDTLNLIK